jgi:AcrR family transcriptional regulator
MATPVKRQKRTSKRRRSVLDASLRCFLRHGVAAATIEQIRDASGASAGSIYHHFGSKQGIAVALYVEGMEELAARYRAAVAEQAPLEAGLLGILQSYFQWMVEHRDWGMYLLRVATADLSAADAEAVDAINRRSRQVVVDWLRPRAERGEILELPEDLYDALVFGQSTHFARHWLAGRLKTDPAVAVRHFATTAWQALTGAAAAARGKPKPAAAARGRRSKKDPQRSRS